MSYAIAGILAVLITLALWVSGFIMYSKIPSDEDSDRNVALVFAVLGIPIPLLELVPIVIGSRY